MFCTSTCSRVCHGLCMHEGIRTHCSASHVFLHGNGNLFNILHFFVLFGCISCCIFISIHAFSYESCFDGCKTKLNNNYTYYISLISGRGWLNKPVLLWGKHRHAVLPIHTGAKLAKQAMMKLMGMHFFSCETSLFQFLNFTSHMAHTKSMFLVISKKKN